MQILHKKLETPRIRAEIEMAEQKLKGVPFKTPIVIDLMTADQMEAFFLDHDNEWDERTMGGYMTLDDIVRVNVDSPHWAEIEVGRVLTHELIHKLDFEHQVSHHAEGDSLILNETFARFGFFEAQSVSLHSFLNRYAPEEWLAEAGTEYLFGNKAVLADNAPFLTEQVERILDVLP